MRMLRQMCVCIRRDERGTRYLEQDGSASVVEKMKDIRLKWFAHVKSRCTYAPMQQCERLAMAGMRRGKGRLKEYQKNVIRHDMENLHLLEDMTLVRMIQSLRITVGSQQAVEHRIILLISIIIITPILAQLLIQRKVFKTPLNLMQIISFVSEQSQKHPFTWLNELKYTLDLERNRPINLAQFGVFSTLSSTSY